ncbi:hypothetical protein [Nocardioides salarius]|uniref:hypothetical protein n=1 Tax=Nocardioides salarius TaxID=374513 RepID=UPI0030F58B13
MSAGVTGLVVAVVVAAGVLVWLGAETALGRGADRSRPRPPVAERWRRRPGLRSAALVLLGLGVGAGVLGAAALAGGATDRGTGLDLVGLATALVLGGVSLLATWWRLAGRRR